MSEGAPGLPLDVVIVGAGVGGLVAAIALRTHGHGQHRVTVLERNPAIQALGAPIQIAPNGSRILIRYGMGAAMEAVLAPINKLATLRSYRSGELLMSVPTPDVAAAYGSPLWTLSRFRLVETLLHHAQSLGVQVLFNKLVKGIDTAAADPTVHTDDGEIYSCHLVVGADGMGSSVRKHTLGQDVRAANPCSAYCINIPRNVLSRDPDLAILLNAANSWLGPGRLIVAIDMPDHGDVCNFILASEHEEGTQGEWYTKGDLSTVKSRFADFEPRVGKFLDLAGPEECYIWRFSSLPTLETWRSSNSRVVLLGDAAHAALPNSGMGATSCIEDSACLAECLTHVEATADLPAAMTAFENIRKPHASFVAEAGRQSMRLVHLPDGPEQETRDNMFKGPRPRPAAASAPLNEGPQPSKTLRDYSPPEKVGPTLSPQIREFTFRYDVLDHTREYFKAAANERNVNSGV